MYASLNMEYPVKSGVALSDMVASWGNSLKMQFHLIKSVKTAL